MVFSLWLGLLFLGLSCPLLLIRAYGHHWTFLVIPVSRYWELTFGNGDETGGVLREFTGGEEESQVFHEN